MRERSMVIGVAIFAVAVIGAVTWRTQENGRRQWRACGGVLVYVDYNGARQPLCLDSAAVKFIGRR